MPIQPWCVWGRDPTEIQDEKVEVLILRELQLHQDVSDSLAQLLFSQE